MNLQERKRLLVKLGEFMGSKKEIWLETKRKASEANPWFIPEFIDLSINGIAENFLTEAALESFIDRYQIAEITSPRKVGLVMAGNIPLVGFHDLLCTFLAGHHAWIKPSSKDEVLISLLVQQLEQWSGQCSPYFVIAEQLKNCDAYIATGSNNSSVYFDYYFSKYPHIIRRNRTSVAILTGHETDEELNALADDVYQHFGLGCRNVTKVFVPKEYNFERLLTIFRKYTYLSNHNKYKNNFDYNLAIHLLNHTYYMSNESLLMIESASAFSPISQLNYSYYDNIDTVKNALQQQKDIQCIVGKSFTSFGKAQRPGIFDYADGVDTMSFLKTLNEKYESLSK